jgi:hypothetical protein
MYAHWEKEKNGIMEVCKMGKHEVIIQGVSQRRGKFGITVRETEAAPILVAGGKVETLDPRWVVSYLNKVAVRIAGQSNALPYYAGFVRCLQDLGAISLITYEELPAIEPGAEPAEPATQPASGEPTEVHPGEQPVWAAWQRR